MALRTPLILVISSFLVICSGCLSLSLGGKHEIVTATDAETQNRLGALEARVQAIEQRMGTAGGPVFQNSTP